MSAERLAELEAEWDRLYDEAIEQGERHDAECVDLGRRMLRCIRERNALRKEGGK